MTLTTSWLFAFLVTLAVELVVGVPLLGPARSTARRAAAVALGQFATHPLVWFAWPALGLSRSAYLFCAEGFAVALELIGYRLVFPDLPWSRALAVSALANAASLVAGLVLRLV